MWSTAEESIIENFFWSRWYWLKIEFDFEGLKAEIYFIKAVKGKVGVDLLTTFTHWEQGAGGVLGYSDFGQ